MVVWLRAVGVIDMLVWTVRVLTLLHHLVFKTVGEWTLLRHRKKELGIVSKLDGGLVILLLMAVIVL